MSPHNESEEDTKFSELKEKLVKVLHDHVGIKEEINGIEIHEPPELKGEHMATETVYGKVEFKDSKLRPRNIFIKKFHANPIHTEMVRKMMFMEKESTFFNEFLPHARKFCANNKGTENLLEFFPDILYADEDMVVLDNLVLDDSFIMLPKEEMQDLETAKLVLSHLAKFHAVSYCMVKEYGADEFRQKWNVNCSESFDGEKNPYMKTMFDSSVGTCLSILQKYPLDGQAETIAYLSSLIGKIYPDIAELLESNFKSDEFVVLNHGDCWNNNMLFKVDPVTKKVVKHIFVDFQITRFGSPCLDMGYFLYTSVKPTVRRAHLKELLQHYFDTFSKTLELFGRSCPLTFSEFAENYKKNSRLGYIFNLTIMSAIGAFKDIDMNSMETDLEKAVEVMNTIINNWIENNPDKTEPIAKELIAVVKEERELQQTKF